VQDGRISLRWPRHPIWNELRIADLPLLSVPLDSAKIAEDAASCAVDVACVVDAGPAEFGGPPSMVQSDGRRCTLVREGGLARQLFEELTLCRILFVCTGNTCRSPLAQALCARLLADRLGVAPGELRQHGFVVQSAGLAAMMGNDASPESVTVAAEFGADLSGHKSTMATLEMLQMADHVFAMTASHWYTLMGVGPAGCVQPRMLSPTFDDIADPIGGALVDYRTCAHQIMECLQLRLPQLLES
jgi:protein-tyrosine phosphatase